MSEPITSELRRAMRIGHAVDEGEQVDAIRHGTFMDLCAAIDSVHANLERENESLRRELDRVLGEEHDFAPESHYMMLPKDSAGEPIHIGDVMDGTCPSGKHVNGTVNAIGDGVFWLSNVQFSLKPDYMRHYHEPTVEDVLRGVVTLCRNTWKEGSAFEFYDVDDVMESGNIADFAAKLRLAGDPE